MRSLKLASLIVAVAVPLASAHAITFSNIFINGVAGTATNPTAFGPNGLSFALPTNYLIGVGTKMAEIKYRVSASSGMLLDTYGIFPVGVTKIGSVDVYDDFTGASVGEAHEYLYIGNSSVNSLLSFPNNPMIHKTAFYDVVTTITLTGTEPASLNKLTILSVSYNETAVPEPASMIAMAIGAGTFFARRRKGQKS